MTQQPISRSAPRSGRRHRALSAAMTVPLAALALAFSAITAAPASADAASDLLTGTWYHPNGTQVAVSSGGAVALTQMGCLEPGDVLLSGMEGGWRTYTAMMHYDDCHEPTPTNVTLNYTDGNDLILSLGDGRVLYRDDVPGPGCESPEVTWETVFVTVDRAAASGLYTTGQLEDMKQNPCHLFMLDVEVEEAGEAGTLVKAGDKLLRCPKNGNEAPSVMWVLKDWYGIVYASLKLSQFACWDGRNVTDSTGKKDPPKAVVTPYISSVGSFTGVKLDEAGKVVQYYDGENKASWRSVLSETKITGSIAFGLAHTYTWSPTLTIVIRANGSVVRDCTNEGGNGHCVK